MKPVMTAVRADKKAARWGGQDISGISILVCISAGRIRVFRSKDFLPFVFFLLLLLSSDSGLFQYTNILIIFLCLWTSRIAEDRVPSIATTMTLNWVESPHKTQVCRDSLKAVITIVTPSAQTNCLVIGFLRNSAGASLLATRYLEGRKQITQLYQHMYQHMSGCAPCTVRIWHQISNIMINQIYRPAIADM